MDGATCNVLYVDRNVREDGIASARKTNPTGDGASPPQQWAEGRTLENINLLIEAFGEVHLFATGAACISKLFVIHDAALIDLKPTLVLIDVPQDDTLPELPSRSRSTSPHSRVPSLDEPSYSDGESYGLRLLHRIVSEAHLRNLTKLVVAIPVVGSSTPFKDVKDESRDPTQVAEEADARASQAVNGATANRRLLRKCLDLGAVNVIVSPLHPKHLEILEVHAYQAHKDATRDQQALLEVRRGRKRSWVGVNEEKPYAYLREAMVSSLMKNICKSGLETDDRISNVKIAISPQRVSEIAVAVGKWHFCAHSFTEDELLVASLVMFKHALAMPELEHWRIPTDELRSFLVACRAAYNSFVPYHNFRHVVDVLQATFNFLVHIGCLSPYPSEDGTTEPPPPKSPIASLLTPFEALTLLITAIGHDVGHPGVNNGFLITLNAPLAQLYNDRSVLEAFHCAAYSQILRRYWPATFEDSKMRQLMTSSILATDMGLHFDYMAKLGDVQDKLHNKNNTDGWNGRMLEDQKVLACSLLIKCADISNVARKHETALKWMHILSDEFSRQASMESELQIPTALFSVPTKEQPALFKSQLGFMNLFAIPLFQGVADILPTLKYTVDELETNKKLFEAGVAGLETKKPGLDGAVSPRSTSFEEERKAKAEDETDVGQSMESGKVLAPAAVIVENRNDRDKPLPTPAISPLSSPVATKAPHHQHIATLSSAATAVEYREVNGITTSFDAVADFAASDPFNTKAGAEGEATGRQHHSPSAGGASVSASTSTKQQRHSETTEGSSSLPYSVGDWTSQATGSVTTGKMPLSPSTQATSDISRDSLERLRPSSVPVTTTSSAAGTGPPSLPPLHHHHLQQQQHHHHHHHQQQLLQPFGVAGADDRPASMVKLHPEAKVESHLTADDDTNGSLPSQDAKLVKKKSSRFLMGHFSFFRRHKGQSPPLPAADMAG